MPSSSPEGKDIICNWVMEFSTSIDTVLDLGVGKGTYHNLLTKKKKGRLLTHCSWIGIEAWLPYIEKYKLRDRYNILINNDIRHVDYSMLPKFDLTIAGDVLEHITKDDSVKVVNDILQISEYLIISIPIIHYPQGEIENNPYEVHVKDDWSHAEMLETFPHITKYWTGKEIGVYLLKK
jgi:predicted TPR repeat methyltransferase